MYLVESQMLKRQDGCLILLERILKRILINTKDKDISFKMRSKSIIYQQMILNVVLN